MKITAFFSLLAFGSLTVFSSCTKMGPAHLAIEDQVEDKLAEARLLTSEAEANLKNAGNFSGQIIRVPAGSVDALADSSAKAGPKSQII